MSIFGFDWMDFNGDGQVDAFEAGMAFGMMDECDRMEREERRRNDPWGADDDLASGLYDDDDFDDLDGDDDFF